MTPALLLALVPLLVDETPRHWHFTQAQLPQEAAQAFVQACTERNPLGEPDLCPIFLTVMAGLESRFQLHIVGDGGKALGPFQEHTGGAARDASWLSSARHYLGTVATAVRGCPDEPIARLAGERCGDSRHHRERWAQMRVLLDAARVSR
jgi:hypothetical protein